MGDNAKIDINLRGREWESPQGEIKYFNSIQGWRIEKVAVDDSNSPIPPITPTESFGDNEDVGKEEPDDLPF